MQLPNYISIHLLLLSLILNVCVSAKPATQNEESRQDLQLDSFSEYISSALNGNAFDDFETISADVKNNIFWKGNSSVNKYESAYKRSIPYLKGMLRDDVPDFIFLIPYLESGWHSKKGRKKADYGYWQMVAEVVAEIKTLDHASDDLKASSSNHIRSDPKLSTEAAIIHLKRYYFYFRHVANFEEADAWLFAVTSYNWGAGNVKRVLLKMADKNIERSFSTFYHYLYESSKKNPDDKSKRVALEYLPNLWNIALLVKDYQENNPITKKH